MALIAHHIFTIVILLLVRCLYAYALVAAGVIGVDVLDHGGQRFSPKELHSINRSNIVT